MRRTTRFVGTRESQESSYYPVLVMRTVLQLADVQTCPKVRQDIPGPLRLGDRVRLRFGLRRVEAHRTYELRVDGEYRVTGFSLDNTGIPTQLVTVESVGPQPVWRSVKNQPPFERPLGPARHPATRVGG